MVSTVRTSGPERVHSPSYMPQPCPALPRPQSPLAPPGIPPGKLGPAGRCARTSWKPQGGPAHSAPAGSGMTPRSAAPRAGSLPWLAVPLRSSPPPHHHYHGESLPNSTL